MNIEVTALLVLICMFLVINISAIFLYIKTGVAFWVSGIVLLIASYPAGLGLGTILIKIEQHNGGVGTSAAFLSILFIIGLAVNALFLLAISFVLAGVRHFLDDSE